MSLANSSSCYLQLVDILVAVTTVFGFWITITWKGFTIFLVLITIKFVDIIEKIQWTLGIHLWTMLQHFIQKIISAIVFFVQIIHEIPCPFSSAKMILTIDFTILYKRATQANINRKSLTHAYFHKTMANIRSNIQLIKFKVMSLQWSSNICQISGKIMDLSDVCGGSLGAVLEWN